VGVNSNDNSDEAGVNSDKAGVNSNKAGVNSNKAGVYVANNAGTGATTEQFTHT